MLYGRPEAVRGLLDLVGWSTRTNYHWGFMNSGYCWTPGNLDTSKYIEQWIKRIERTTPISRPDWEAKWSEMRDAGIVRAADKTEFDRRFTNTQIQNATPRPGLVCERAWSMTEAMTLDDSARFVTIVRDEVVKLLEQLQERDMATQVLRT